MDEQPPETPNPPDASSPAEARLHDLLDLVRALPPRPPARLTADVLRAARFERHLRSGAIAATQIGAAALEGLALLLGLRRPRR
jgi:hypothetical protein